MMRMLIFAAVAALMGSQAHASTWEEKYFTVSSVEVREIADNSSQAVQAGITSVGAQSSIDVADAKCLEAEAKGVTARSMNLTPTDLTEMLKIGKDLWSIVENNKPVADVKGESVTVLPLHVQCWRWLDGWQNPVAKTYQVTFKNLLGVNVVDFKYKVLFLYGGGYQGQGHFLARVAMIPQSVDVIWGFTFNASVAAPTVLNYGTFADPVAGVELELKYTVDTVLKHHASTVNFLVKGNGEAIAL